LTHERGKGDPKKLINYYSFFVVSNIKLKLMVITLGGKVINDLELIGILEKVGSSSL
jgi:hypothetical protein